MRKLPNLNDRGRLKRPALHPERHYREKDVERAAVQWAERAEWWVRKFSSPGHRAVPDRVFAKNGRVVWIEFKAPGEKPRRDQELEMERMRAHGMEVYWVDDPNDAIDILEDINAPGQSKEVKGEWLEI